MTSLFREAVGSETLFRGAVGNGAVGNETVGSETVQRGHDKGATMKDER